jgi:hypothetical protein
MIDYKKMIILVENVITAHEKKIQIFIFYSESIEQR